LAIPTSPPPLGSLPGPERVKGLLRFEKHGTVHLTQN
jgi:hypothetical protein